MNLIFFWEKEEKKECMCVYICAYVFICLLEFLFSIPQINLDKLEVVKVGKCQEEVREGEYEK